MVDSNVLIDVTAGNSTWEDWSASWIRRLANDVLLAINPLIFAEVSIGFDSIEALDDALPANLFQRMELPYEAAFLAGKAFRDYRRRGGLRISPMPDFYIGAHASIAGYRLLTRDPIRYRTYFPGLELISPE